jgi:hypothetical protein
LNFATTPESRKYIDIIPFVGHLAQFKFETSVFQLMPMLFPPEYPDCPDAPLQAFGPSFSEEIARSVVQAVWHENREQPRETEVRLSAGLTMLEAFHPRDQLECMFAAQAVAMHTGVMECMSRAMHVDTPDALAIKLRANAAQLNRSFSLIVRDLERRQSKPLPERPEPSPLDPVSPVAPPANRASPRSPKPRKPAVKNPLSENSSAQNDLPEDIETRPDGTPGSLSGYMRKPPIEEYIPREPAIMLALATRPKPWRMVNTPKADPGESEPIDGDEPVAEPTPPPAPPPAREPLAPHAFARGPVDVNEKIFSGDALARFASARFDPHAPIEPLRFDEEDSVVELELISTGGDPETEARRAAMIAAHPEGKPIVTIRHGSKKPPEEPP